MNNKDDTPSASVSSILAEGECGERHTTTFIEVSIMNDKCDNGVYYMSIYV